MSLILKDELIILSESPAIKLLGNEYLSENFQSCSYDLRVGSVFKGKQIISTAFQIVNENSIVEVKPSEIVTILTMEEVNLPKDIAGTVFAMNSFSSRGFLILNPGHIDPGYSGPISICAINLSNVAIPLQLNKTPIFTILFEKLSKNAEGYKKNEKLSRISKEEKFSINRARKLSTSFFDLITVEDNQKHLRNLVVEILLKKALQIIAIVGALIGIVVGIKKLSESDNSGLVEKYTNERNLLMDSIKKVNSKYDSLFLEFKKNK